MKRPIFFTAAAAAASLFIVALSFASDAKEEPVPVPAREPSGVPSVAPELTEFTYGPILSRDPAIRGQLKRLYREQWDYNQEAKARLEANRQASLAETDPDLRFLLDQEGAGIKREVEIRNVELGLEIARLNGDGSRVAEFERALDQLLHPEKYRPLPVDPSIAGQRARDREPK